MEDGKVMSKLDVLYEDNHVIVVLKPYNVLSQGDSTGDISLMDMVKSYIKEKYHKPGNVYLGLVHRLDRPVGGIMVFARSSKAASRLTKCFNEHSIQKKYLAVVHGRFQETKGVFKDFLEKGKDGNTSVSPSGKKALLEYEVLEYNKEHDCSLVSIDLKTGRHHQIRVQFATRGHSLLGDQRYGVLDYKQIHLYAYYLAFPHPISKKIMSFQSYPKKVDFWSYFSYF